MPGVIVNLGVEDYGIGRSERAGWLRGRGRPGVQAAWREVRHCTPGTAPAHARRGGRWVSRVHRLVQQEATASYLKQAGIEGMPDRGHVVVWMWCEICGAICQGVCPCRNHYILLGACGAPSGGRVRPRSHRSTLMPQRSPHMHDERGHEHALRRRGAAVSTRALPPLTIGTESTRKGTCWCKLRSQSVLQLM